MVKESNIVAIIQARTSSSRLPGKVLRIIEGMTVIEHIVERVKKSTLIDSLVVATSTHSSDDDLANLCKKRGITVFRGSLENVLNRFDECAKHTKASNVLRITGDCPLIDPVILDAVILSGIAGGYDLFGLSGGFPDGLDCTLISSNALHIANLETTLRSDKEHVCPYIEKNPQKFKLGSIEIFHNLETKRWTLDELDDLKFIELVYKSLYKRGEIFTSLEILQWLNQNPQVDSINKHIIRNEGYIKSLENDNSIND